MTFRKSATRSHALDNQPAESIGHKRHAKPLHRSTYGQHRFLPTFAVLTGSVVALSGAMVLQSSVFAQVAPATIRAAGSFDQQGAPTKPPVRVEAIRALTTPQTTPQTISIPSSLAAPFSGIPTVAQGPVRAGAALKPRLVTKPVGAVLATGSGPLDTVGTLATVQLASLIEDMPQGDLGPLVLASGAITLNARSRDDIASGQVDQRVLAMLIAVSFDHQIEVTVLRSGHSKYVKGTKRLSNHILGRAVDIGAVDGRLVRTSNKGARAIVDQLLSLPAQIRPSEIGSPWNTDAPETFTDSGHDDHLHIGFDF